MQSDNNFQYNMNIKKPGVCQLDVVQHTSSLKVINTLWSKRYQLIIMCLHTSPPACCMRNDN